MTDLFEILTHIGVGRQRGFAEIVSFTGLLCKRDVSFAKQNKFWSFCLSSERSNAVVTRLIHVLFYSSTMSNVTREPVMSTRSNGHT